MIPVRNTLNLNQSSVSQMTDSLRYSARVHVDDWDRSLGTILHTPNKIASTHAHGFLQSCNRTRTCRR